LVGYGLCIVGVVVFWLGGLVWWELKKDVVGVWGGGGGGGGSPSCHSGFLLLT